MSDSAVLQRRENSSHKTFSNYEKLILVGWIISRDSFHLNITSKKFSEFIWMAFREIVSSSWLTRFCKRHFLSFKIASNVHSLELTEKVILESIQFLNFVKSLKIPADKRIIIDKTLLQSNPQKVYHIAPTGKNRPRRIGPKPGTVDVVYTYLKGNGTHSKFYIQISDSSIECDIINPELGTIQYIPLKFPRRGERGVFLFFQYLIEQKELTSNDLLIFDGEKSFTTDLVLDLLYSHNITILVFPSALHELLNPCDNNFHNCFKQLYYSKLTDLSSDKISHLERIEIACDSYLSIKETSVINMFHRCGIVENFCSTTVVNNLVSERNYWSNEQKFEEELQLFLSWAQQNNYDYSVK